VFNQDVSNPGTGSIDLEAFEDFVAAVEPRLRRALVAAYGSDRGRDATAEALAYAWEHWSRLQSLDNPTGYLFRVAQSRVRRRRVPILFEIPETAEIRIEPRLPEALRSLSQNQRLAVVLVHAFGWKAAEVADLLGVNTTTVRNHLERGLRRLRESLGVDHDD
jgi:RNA polymerase sigma factor (sigma-70 family)